MGELIILMILLSFNNTTSRVTDSIFEKLIMDNVISYETKIPWSLDHYLELAPEPETIEIVEQQDNNTSVQTDVEEPIYIEETTEVEVANEVVPGDHGILSIDNILQVGLQGSGDSQAVTNDERYAYIWYMSDSCIYIADHNYQAFKSLPNVYVGCSANMNGRNITCVCTDYGYCDEVGFIRMSDDSYAGENYGNCVVMYTCTSGSGRFISIWQ